MTTERKLWWRKVVAVAIGGGVVAGGLVGVVRATTDTHKPVPPVVEDAAWTRLADPVVPAVAEVDRRDVPPGEVIQVGAALPIPVPSAPTPVAPAVPVIPAPPAPFPPNLEPVGAGPRVPDAGSGADKNLLPPVPSLPPVELPKVPAAQTPPAAKPTIPAPPMDLLPQLPVPSAPPAAGLPAPTTPGSLPALPALPGGTAEPQKVPVVPAPPAPVMPVVPPPAGIAPLIPPVQTTESVQPMLPGKPDSGLNPTIPGNTLNPTPPTGAAMPAGFPPKSPGGRDVPGTPVDRPKPPEPSFGSTDKFSVPAANPLSPTPRESAMLNLKQTAALAVLSGAMLTAEQARSAVPLPPIVPAVPVKAAEKTETEKLRDDLTEANKKITALETSVKGLTELLKGKKDTDGTTILPSDPGAVEEIKRLKNRIAELDNELKSLKTQTALKPAIVPEAKPRGIVKVVNEYPVEISMVINEKSHRILPNTKIDVEVPAGEFSYQLLQSGAAVTRSVIKDKETVTLRIK
ncbi:hypothetical protein J8F10_07985 [Gemmata sp. G18]|uniref:Uncharacterized protein n=1 Tax=Gemmata palustris TaxID=2822762 RepID=A0ABS5BNF7_9BACT|nr:hypothetical protein [Gemmata palustris]MBP3955219.1 hypothetical protein [Gemmata palustris]